MQHNDAQHRLAAVRDAYRLIHGYQTSLKDILDYTIERFSPTDFWEWEPTGGRPVTGRTCPLTAHDAGSFLPLFDSYFYYTTRPPQEAIEPGDRVLYIQHHADTEFAADNGTFYSLDSNKHIEPASAAATSEIALSVIVNLTGNTLSWSDIDKQWNADVELYPVLHCGTETDGYTKGICENEWTLPEPVELGGHTFQIVARAAQLEELVNTKAAQAFVDNLKERVDALPVGG